MALLRLAHALLTACLAVRAQVVVAEPELSTSVLTEKVAKKYLEDIERNLVIDAQHPPMHTTGGTEKTTCLAHLATCNPTYFYQKHAFINGTVKAFYVPHTELSTVQLLHGKSIMEVTRSTSVALATTKGWTAGARLTWSGSLGGVQAALELSASYTTSYTQTMTTSKTVSTRAECEYPYDCEIQTWTFHVTMEGVCTTRPFINCGGAFDACTAYNPVHCKQWDDYTDEWCTNEVLYREHECTAQMVVENESGEPFTRLVVTGSRIDETE